MPTTRHIALFTALLLASLHTTHAQTAQEDSVRLVVQQGHSGEVTSLAFSPDGSMVLSGSTDKNLKLWDVAKGRIIHTFTGHTKDVTSVAFSPDGRTALSGSNDGTLKLWDVATGRELRTFAGHTGYVNTVAFSPDGRTVLSGGGDGTLKLWDVGKGQEIQAHELITTEGNISDVNSVAFSPDGLMVLSGGDEMRLWDVASGQEIRTFEGKDLYTSVAFSPDGQTALSGSYGDSLKLWDVASGREIRTFGGHTSSVLSVAFSPNGRLVLSGSPDHTLKLWDVATGQELLTFTSHSDKVTSVAFSPDGRTALSGGGWYEEDTGVIRGELKLWDVATWEEIRTFKGHTGNIESVALSNDGRTVLSGGWDGMKLWDVVTGRKLSTFEGHTRLVRSVAFSPDGRQVLSGGWDNTLKLWDVATEQELWMFSEKIKEITSIELSKDGKSALICGGFMVLLDLSTGQELRRFYGRYSGDYSGYTAAMHPTKPLAISGGGIFYDSLSLWDLSTGQVLRKLGGQLTGVLSVAFSPDGRTALSGGGDNTPKLWDVATGEALRTFKGHTGWIQSVAFSPDGRTALSGSEDETLKVWDVATGKALRTFVGHTSGVSMVVFSPDGQRALSGSDDATVRYWNVDTGTEIVSFIAVGDSTDCIARTPDGYYKTTKGGLQAVHYVKGLTVYPFENFDLKYNRPDIVLQRIGLAPQELIDAYYLAYKKRLKKMGFKEEDLSGELHLPDVRLLNDELPYQTDQAAFRLPFTATDTKFTLDRINVFINDVPLYGTQGLSLRGKDLSSLEQTLDLQLSAGENKIQVSVLNSAGVESLKETHYVTYTPATPVKPTLYVLSIGVSKYRQSQYNLTYAAKDARDIAEYFRQNPGTYQEVKELVLTDADATTENILAARQFLAQAGVDDQVLVFVAGHGLLDGEYNYYFGAHGIDFLNPQAGGLPYEDLEGLLDGLPCRKKLLLMDTCHSGEADEDDLGIAAASDSSLPSGEVVFRNAGPGATKKEGQLGLKNSFELMNELFTDLRRGSGAHVISSAGGGEFALEGSEWQNGVFTYALLSGLKSGAADANQDGTITVSEIRSYVGQQVETLTRGAQRPTARQENLEYDFVVR